MSALLRLVATISVLPEPTSCCDRGSTANTWASRATTLAGAADGGSAGSSAGATSRSTRSPGWTKAVRSVPVATVLATTSAASPAVSPLPTMRVAVTGSPWASGVLNRRPSAARMLSRARGGAKAAGHCASRTSAPPSTVPIGRSRAATTTAVPARGAALPCGCTALTSAPKRQHSATMRRGHPLARMSRAVRCRRTHGP